MAPAMLSSMDVYQTTFPSLLAASTNSGVTLGAACEKEGPAAKAVAAPPRTPRRVIMMSRPFMAYPPSCGAQGNQPGNARSAMESRVEPCDAQETLWYFLRFS